MCDKSVDSYLLALKFILDWLVPSNMIEKLYNVIFSNDDMVFWDIDSDIVTLFSNDISLNSINLINFNLDDDDPKTINHVRFMADEQEEIESILTDTK